MANLLARHVSPVTLLCVLMLTVGLSFVVSADQALPFAWFFRSRSDIAGYQRRHRLGWRAGTTTS